MKISGGGYHSVSQADRGSQAIQMLQDFTPETKPDFIILGVMDKIQAVFETMC